MDFIKYECGMHHNFFKKKKRCAKLSDLKIDENLRKALIKIYGNFELFPPQQEAIFEKNLLNSRKNFVIASPTNSGKTFLAILKLFSEALLGKKGIYIIPYKAAAVEKKIEFENISKKLKKKIDVLLTTGDTKDDLFDSSPPKNGEIIITTPERMDSIMRSSNFYSWLDRVSTIVFDEIHLIDNEKRGPVLEYIIARLIALQNYPQLICLSATIGNLEDISNWLKPCAIVTSTFRSSPLRMFIYIPKEDAKKEDYVYQIADDVLKEKGTILVFSSTRKNAERYAKAISQKHQAAYFHAGLSAKEREKIRRDYEKGKIKAIVATTTLSEGVNLPATHVLIADSKYWDGKMKNRSVRSIVQMIGRAGRKTEGTGILLLDRKTDEQTINYYLKHLKEGKIEPIKSRIFTSNAKEEILAHLVIQERVELKAFEEFFSNLFSKTKIHFKNILDEFVELGLAFFDGKFYFPTHLGKVISKTYIPIETGIAFTQLLEDLLELSKEGIIDINSLHYLDIIFAVCARNEEKLKFSNSENSQSLLDGEKSLFLPWLGNEMAARLLESLNISPSEYKDAKKYAKKIMISALAVNSFLNGKSSSDIGENFGLDSGDLESYVASIPYLINGFRKIAWLLGRKDIAQKCANLLESFP